MEMLNQYLPLSSIVAVKFCGQHHPSLADKGSTRQHANYSSEVCQVTGNQHHKTLVKMRKSPMRELFAPFKEGLSTRFAGQIGLIGEMGKKLPSIQFERWP